MLQNGGDGDAAKKDGPTAAANAAGEQPSPSSASASSAKSPATPLNSPPSASSPSSATHDEAPPGAHPVVLNGGGGGGRSEAGSSSQMEKADDGDCSQQTVTNPDEDCAGGGGGGEDEEDGSNDPGKMFIGGLSWQTTAEGLRDYFSSFGEVNECMVMRDPATKRARGFGFITFVDAADVNKVLVEEHHELDGKKIDPKVAFPRRPQPKMIVKTKKIFIGGLSANSTLEDMKDYFGQFGKIEDAMLMFDKATQRHRGFGFITFDDDEVSDRICEIHFHEINGKMVECKKAQPKEVMLPVQLNKNRAAAARNLYGLAPEQLLAYATYMPRLANPYGPPGVLYPPGGVFNGYGAPPPPPPPPQSFALSPSARSSVSGSNLLAHPHHHHHHVHHHAPNSSSAGAGGGGGPAHIHPSMLGAHDLATVRMAAQQQAVFDAAFAYASGAIGSGAPGADFHHGQPHFHQPQPHFHQPQQHAVQGDFYRPQPPQQQQQQQQGQHQQQPQQQPPAYK